MAGRPHIAYLFSRYPVVSQTFCDSEMLALESMGVRLSVASINAPPNSFRHARLAGLKAEAHYPPPPAVLKALPTERPENWNRLRSRIEAHAAAYGPGFKAETRARNALWIADLFEKIGVDHVHVHFANRATHTALFLKDLGFSFSFTAHAQDFMVDLGSDELLAEMARDAEFVIAVSDHSKALLEERCAESADKIHRVYNGIDPEVFLSANPAAEGPFRILAIGRLIEFKGFHHLIDACAALEKQGIDSECTIVGEGPWRNRLEEQASGSGASIRFAGVLGQEDVKEELARSHVFCLPSIVDAKGASDILPTVIMEAMAARLPVVSTRLVGIPEMVENAETGLLVKPGDVGALSEALASVASDRSKAVAYGEAGRALVEERFALGITAAQLKKHFESALSGVDLCAKPDSPAVLYYLDAWPAPDLAQLAEEVDLAGARSEFACVAGEGSELSGEVEFFPDGIVLEADWRSDPESVAVMERLRTELGSSVAGETFFRAARRALHLSMLMKKRGIERIHAARADGLLCAWLVNRIGGYALSAAIEEKPPVSRAMLAKLLPDCHVTSISDSKLAEKLGESEDVLGLRVPPTHRKVGPIKVRREDTEKDREQRRERARAWLDILVAS